MTLAAAALNLVVAMICGSVIGSERQARHRMAGLRTNALVALGAAGFVTFSALHPAELSPTRVGAQVVSGIGFLGAGIIFRTGFSVHGVNTAATLWCSAAVGVIAGAGAIAYAILLTAIVIFTNLGLRPIVKWIKIRTGGDAARRQDYRVTILVSSKEAPKMRKVLSEKLAVEGLQIVQFEGAATEEGDEAELRLVVAVEERGGPLFQNAIGLLMLDPRVRHLNWEPVAEA